MLRVFGEILFGEVGDFADHVVLADVEVDVTAISLGDGKRLEDYRSAFVINCAGEQGIDHVHERSLNRLGVLDESDGTDFGIHAGLDALDHASVEVTEIFFLEGRGAAAVSGDGDVGALAGVGMNGHGYIPRKTRFAPKSMS